MSEVRDTWRPGGHNNQTVRSIVIAVISAAILSAGGTFVAVKVQEHDIRQNAADVAALEVDVENTRADMRLTKLETASSGNERRHDENYIRISAQLRKLQADIDTITRRLPARRPR